MADLFQTNSDGLFQLPKPRQKSARDPLAQIAASNERNIARLGAAGIADPTKKKNPSALERIFGVLDVPGSGVRSIVHNVTNPYGDKDVDPLAEMFKALKGEKRVEGADIVGDWGVDNKWAKLGSGLLVDVLLDPVTYLSFGIGGAGKSTLNSLMDDVVRFGDDIAGLTEKVAANYGDDVARQVGEVASKYAPKVAERGGWAGVDKTLGTEVANDLTRVLSESGKVKGGVKFMGQTVLDTQTEMNRAAQGLKGILRGERGGTAAKETLAPVSKWFERAFLYPEGTAELMRSASQPYQAFLKGAVNRRNAAAHYGEELARAFAKKIETVVPDEKVRSLITIGIGRQFGDEKNLVEMGRLVKLAENADTPEAAEAAVKAVQQARGIFFDPDAVGNTIRTAVDAGAVQATDDEIQAAIQAADDIQAAFDASYRQLKDAGVDTRLLYPASDNVASVSEDAKPMGMTLDEFVQQRPAVDGYQYHGSPYGDLPSVRPGGEARPEGIGFYTTDSRDVAGEYAKGLSFGGFKPKNAGEAGRVNYIRGTAKNTWNMSDGLDEDFVRAASKFLNDQNAARYIEAGEKVPKPIVDAEEALAKFGNTYDFWYWLADVADNEGLNTGELLGGFVDDWASKRGYDALVQTSKKLDFLPHQVTVWRNPPEVVAPEDVYHQLQQMLVSEPPPLSAGYMPGRDLSRRTGFLDRLRGRDNAAAQKTANDDLLSALTGDLPPIREETVPTALDEMARVYGSGTERAKTYLNPEMRRQGITREGEALGEGLPTELDSAFLAQGKLTKDSKRIAYGNFIDEVSRTAGDRAPEVVEQLRKMEPFFTNDKATQGFLRASDKVLNVWRKWATVYNFPMFPARNWTSNKFLLWTENIMSPEAYGDALKIVANANNADELAKVSVKGLGSAADLLDEAKKLRVWVGESESLQLVGDKQMSKLGTFLGDANQRFVEDADRMAGYIAARRKGLDPEASAELVNRALYNYDPKALTSFERNVMRRVMPFYTFTRRNLPHMATLLAENPGKLTWIGHLKESGEAATGIQSEEMPSYLRNLFGVPLPVGKTGATILSTGGVLPISDLERLLPQNPKEWTREQLAQLNPFVRDLFIEFPLNKDIWRNSEIQTYPGELRRAPDFVNNFDALAQQVPVVRRAWEVVKTTLGIREKESADGQTYLAMNPYAAKAIKDFVPWMNSVGRLTSGDPEGLVTQGTGIKLVPYEPEEWKRQQVYEAQDKLSAALRRAKDEGKVPKQQPKKSKPKTLNDLFGR